MSEEIKQEHLARKAWDNEAEAWTSRNQKMWDQGSRKKILPFLNAHIKAPAKVLDIGCSGGYSTYKLNEMGYQATGLDISEEMIKIASKTYPHLLFNQGDISKIAMADEVFDAALCINVFEFTSEPTVAIDEVYRILKPGGRACVGILGPTAAPRRNSFERLYGESVMMNTMQAWEFQQVAERKGFKIIAGMPVEKQWPIALESLPTQAQQALSFMYVFILEK